MRALVTGGSGFVGGHVVAKLLADGHAVHTTVRSRSSRAKLSALQSLANRYPGQLTLFEADLLTSGSFDAAMAGCEVVHHVASPFLMPEKIQDGGSQLVEPALKGTENVLASVDATQSVERVVLTSTIGAIFGDYVDVLAMPNGVLSEAYFNETSSISYNPYHYSKVVAEKRAWEISRRQSRWDLVTIHPSLVLGPTLTYGSESGSLFLLDELLSGKYFYGVPKLGFAVVDVRDVAAAHASAATNPGAHGRYIVSHERMVSFHELARLVRLAHPRGWSIPRTRIPNWLMYLVGPAFGLSHKYLKNHLDIDFPLDNRRSMSELGVSYRPFVDTVRDHVVCWCEQRGLAPSKVPALRSSSAE
jgi:nucleoside-diphosphate-sugar epimerase